MEIVVSVLMLIGGFVLLTKGADWFVDGAADIAARFHIPSLVIGLTVVAMGTSLPEAAISIIAAIKGSAGIAIGNVVGSNIMNVALILGITAIITPLAVRQSTRRYEMPIMILATVVMALLGLIDQILQRPDGCVLLALFAGYLFYTIRMAAAEKPRLKPHDDAEGFAVTRPDEGGETTGLQPGEMEAPGTALQEQHEELGPPRRSQRHRSASLIIAITMLGAACIAVGSELTVNGATEIARTLGISEKIIGLTIVAFGTSLPELVTCVAAALKRETDIAVGNIVGSNIFNILFVIGTAATIHPVPYGREFLMDTAICTGIAVLLWVLASNRSGMLKRWGGIVLLSCYIAYFLLFNLDLISKFGIAF